MQARAVADALLKTTTSLCRACKRAAPAEVWRIGGAVVMRKVCDVHGPSEVVVSPNADWYDGVLGYQPVLAAPHAKKQVEQGCPFDCGPCTSHEQQTQLPIVPITSACNLDCPICYTHNRNDGAFHMSEAQLGAILEHLRAADPERRIINLTGGEPTQHPQFERIIERCVEEGIHRITVSTHGLRFLKDERLLERLATLGARIVLSFDSFKPETNQHMLGGNFLDGKLRVLDPREVPGGDHAAPRARAWGQRRRGRCVHQARARQTVHPVGRAAHGARELHQWCDPRRRRRGLGQDSLRVRMSRPPGWRPWSPIIFDVPAWRSPPG